MSVDAHLVILGRETDEFIDDEFYQNWVSSVKKELTNAIREQLNEEVEWIEGQEPEIQIGQDIGSRDNFIQLQRYAAYIHFTGAPPKAPADEGELLDDKYLMYYYNAIKDEDSWENRNLEFKHLNMALNRAYFIPLDFPEPIIVEPEDGNQDELQSFGSSFQLYRELEEVNKHLLVVGDFEQLGEDEAWRFYENEEDQWRFVRWAWIILHWLARESIKRKLCIHLA